LITEDAFRRLVLENSVRLHGAMNRDFFENTIVEREAAAIISTMEGARAGGAGDSTSAESGIDR
jgi:hypothetical protein